jgi:hypothetical protein
VHGMPREKKNFKNPAQNPLRFSLDAQKPFRGDSDRFFEKKIFSLRWTNFSERLASIPV